MQSKCGANRWNAKIWQGRNLLESQRAARIRLPATWNFKEASVCVKKKLNNVPVLVE
jgi:hypothetical protein